jgi:hypothetical protein
VTDPDIRECCRRQCREDDCENQAIALFVQRGMGSPLCEACSQKRQYAKHKRQEFHRLSLGDTFASKGADWSEVG